MAKGSRISPIPCLFRANRSQEQVVLLTDKGKTPILLVCVSFIDSESILSKLFPIANIVKTQLNLYRTKLIGVCFSEGMASNLLFRRYID